MILKPHALSPLIGLVLGQGLLNTGITIGASASANLQAGVAVEPAPGAAATPAPDGWVYNGCFAGFPGSSSWIVYTPGTPGAVTDAGCAASCRPYRAALQQQVYAVVYSNPPGDADFCLCTDASVDALTTDGCFRECAPGVLGRCAAEGKANVYSVGPASDQVRGDFSSVVGVFDVKLCHVYKCEGGGGVSAGELWEETPGYTGRGMEELFFLARSQLSLCTICALRLTCVRLELPSVFPLEERRARRIRTQLPGRVGAVRRPRCQDIVRWLSLLDPLYECFERVPRPRRRRIAGR